MRAEGTGPKLLPEGQAGTHLKVHGDRGPSPLLLVIGGQQFNLRTDLGFLHSSHTFYPVRESPEVRRCLSLLNPSQHVLRAPKRHCLPKPGPCSSPDPTHSLPDNGILAGLVLRLPLHTDDLHSTGVQRRWDPDLEGTIC